MDLELLNELKDMKFDNGPEQLLGLGIVMPNNAANSGSRKLLEGTQFEQILPVMDSEVPILGTGYESEVGRYSSTFIEADEDMDILDVIYKFDPQVVNIKYNTYYAIVYRKITGKIDVIERMPYSKIVTEKYGTLLDNNYIDSLVGHYGHIAQGDIIRKSTSVDEYNNRKFGVNLLLAYVSREYTKEDSIIISESAQKKFQSPLINILEIQINDNDIPLDLYGDGVTYKIMPDVGEEVKDRIVCSLRRENGEHMLYSQTKERLREVFLSDDSYLSKGTIIDIDVYSNKPSLLDSKHYDQLKYYNDMKISMHQNIINSVDKCMYNLHLTENDMTEELAKLYELSKMVVRGTSYVVGTREPSNIILKVAVLEINTIKPADKITNRYGGKGCISKVLPDEEMPMLENGKRVEAMYTPPSVISRTNLGVLLEQSINFATCRLIEGFRDVMPSAENNHNNKGIKYSSYEDWAFDCATMLCDFLSIISEKMAAEYHGLLMKFFNSGERVDYMIRLVNDGYLVLSLDPINEGIDIDKIAKLYSEFDLKPYKVLVPMKGSDGNVRYVQSRRELICGYTYIWRLKQYSENKVAAVSLSSTNIKNQNSKTNSKKLGKSLISKTCIRFGEMETGNLLHLSPEIVIANLMINSLSPKGRRNFIELYNTDVFNIDIKLKNDSDNVAVEILNAKLKSIGLKLIFENYSKIKTPIFTDSVNIYTSNKLDLYKDRHPWDFEKMYKDKVVKQKLYKDRFLKLYEDEVKMQELYTEGVELDEI